MLVILNSIYVSLFSLNSENFFILNMYKKLNNLIMLETLQTKHKHNMTWTYKTLSTMTLTLQNKIAPFEWQ